MAGITLEIAEARLTAYLAAEEAVMAGQRYVIDIGGNRREVTRADLAAIQAGITLWNGRCKALSAGGRPSVRYVIPV